MLIRRDKRIKIIPEQSCFLLVHETSGRYTVSMFVVRFSVCYDCGPVLVASLYPDKKVYDIVLYTNNSNLCYKSYFNNVTSYCLKFS
jgi:hypothetical protein